MKKQKKKKPEFVDDGRTIASMDFEEISGYKSAEQRERHKQLVEVNMTKKERRALYRGVLGQIMPAFICFLVCLVTVLVVFYFVMK